MLTLRDGPGERRMVESARAAGVRMAGLSEYYRDDAAQRPDNTVIVGYAALADEQIDELAQVLKAAWR